MLSVDPGGEVVCNKESLVVAGCSCGRRQRGGEGPGRDEAAVFLRLHSMFFSGGCTLLFFIHCSVLTLALAL